MQQDEEFIHKCIDYNDEKIVSVPLEFGYLPVDIVSKQFTKLNSPHEHRIHYLGPRYANTQMMHKKCAYSQANPLCKGVPDKKVNRYRLDLKKITNSYFINEKLRNNHFYKSGIYYRAFEGMNPTFDLSQEFIFHGSFESANLDCVIQYKPKEFDLFLRIDSNTRGHIQWFYFSIQNGNKLQKIRLNICNILKPGTLYELDMQPYIFSKKAFETRGQTWQQGGGQRVSNISFTQKPYNYKILSEKINTNPYCYSFQYEFEFQHDEVFFAYCIPYTYSQMINDISRLPQQLIRIYSMGRTLSGLEIPMLHITDHCIFDPTKRSILITGRIHPGESNGSHVLKGFIDFLCSNSSEAVELRRLCNFLIVPMLNPDGVVLGNSRCSASGRDLNRIFPQANKQLFPEIQNLKNFTAKFLNSKSILIYFDFHGHSRKKNTFFYGPSFPLSSPNYLKCRVLPRIIEKINCCFRYYSCMFAINETKKSTGRAAMFQSFKIPFTYTVQSSIGFYYDCEQLRTFPYTKDSYSKMGSSICEGTSTFVTALNQYQNFLRERRAGRQRQRNQRSAQFRRNYSHSTKYSQDQSQFQVPRNNTLKLSYNRQNQECLFIKLLQQVKKLPETNQKVEKQANIDNEASSDDHDQGQDFQNTKLKEFNDLIIQNARKDNLMSRLSGPEEDKKLYGRNNMGEREADGHQTFSKMNLEDEELQLLEEMNMNIKVKPNTSQGMRYKVSQSPRQRIKINTMKLNSKFLEDVDKNVDMDLNIQASKFNTRENFLGGKTLFENFIPVHHSRVQKERRIRSSTKFRDQQQKSKAERSTHYSQIQFPAEQDKFQKRELLRHQKTDLLRRTLQRKRQEKSRLQNNFNCSQMTIIKHNRKGISQTQNQITQSKKIIQIKIDDLMSDLQFRSRLMKDSVKYKDQRKARAKSNTIFPSSFYGVKQQLNSKRQPSLNKESSKIIQETKDLTVKTFYKC